MSLRIAFLAILGLATTFLYAEDVIYLRNGEVLQGQVLGEDPVEQVLQVRLINGQEYKIRNSDIAQVGAQQSFSPPQPQFQPNFYPNNPQQPGVNNDYAQNPPLYGQPNAPYGFYQNPMAGRSLSSVNRQSEESTQGKKSWLSSLRWGVRAGLNSANAKLSDASKASSVSGGAVSVLAEVPVWGRLSLQGELGFSQYGFAGTLSGDSVKLNYDVVEAQLLGKFRLFNSRNKFNVSILGGVAPAYRASATISSGLLSLDATTISKQTTASGVVGGGVYYRIGKTTELGLDVRHTVGLMNMSDIDNISVKNATTFVGASLIF